MEVEVLKTDEQLEELAKQAMRKLSQFFRKSQHDSTDIGEIRVATSVLATWTRQNQVRASERSITLSIAKELNLDKEQFAQVVKETMPQLSIIKLISPAKLPIEEENERLKAESARKTETIVTLQNQLAEPK